MEMTLYCTCYWSYLLLLAYYKLLLLLALFIFEVACCLRKCFTVELFLLAKLTKFCLFHILFIFWELRLTLAGEATSLKRTLFNWEFVELRKISMLCLVIYWIYCSEMLFVSLSIDLLKNEWENHELNQGEFFKAFCKI